MIRIPVGRAAELVYFPLTKAAHVLSPPEAQLLGCCGQFASLGAHAERVVSGLPPGAVDARGTVGVLRALAEDGMMLPRAELLGRLAALPRPEAPPRISWLAVPTSSRPELLRRALQSYASHFARNRRFPKLLVVDDSPTPEASRLSKEAVEEYSEGWGSDVVYSGAEQKRELIDRLSGNGSLPRDVLEFGIFGSSGFTPTMGANRNTILLRTAGDVILSVDDDTICQPSSPSGCAASTLRLGSEVDPTEFWFFPDRESGLAFVRHTDVDILAAHERLLGRQVWTLADHLDLKNAGKGVDLSAACTDLLQDIWFATGSVRITLNGSVGDSGMYSGRNLPLHRGPHTRQGMTGSEADYNLALRSREVVRQATATTVCHGSPIMTMFIGMDNRGFLPPFFPVGRNEDGTFAYLLGRCAKGCYFEPMPR